ncbi:hypothetical protein F1728_15110 [Gimesia benthica]|uniref:Uncharacterized protein n=1 Tax=Gimesia benthica TaxID=2608982 RepID=A0A6I6ACR2_9PLAN|nr:hypothetical protein [Gimesia benthica]QGQ23928.1 hypothetical protein F1728_15110 [Gimesia benthica]
MAINQPEENNVVEMSAEDPKDSIWMSTFMLFLIGFGLAGWIKNVIFEMWHTIIFGNKIVSDAMPIELAVGIVVAIYATCFWCDWGSYNEDSCCDGDSLVSTITAHSVQGMLWGMMVGGMSIPILLLYGLYKLFIS